MSMFSSENRYQLESLTADHGGLNLQATVAAA
jgi:hypothetical protein